MDGSGQKFNTTGFHNPISGKTGVGRETGGGSGGSVYLYVSSGSSWIYSGSGSSGTSYSGRMGWRFS